MSQNQKGRRSEEEQYQDDHPTKGERVTINSTRVDYHHQVSGQLNTTEMNEQISLRQLKLDLIVPYR